MFVPDGASDKVLKEIVATFWSVPESKEPGVTPAEPVILPD